MSGFDRGPKAPLPGVSASEIAAAQRKKQREIARASGFTGDFCGVCGGAHMQVAGHCMVCADCGTTTGCS